MMAVVAVGVGVGARRDLDRHHRRRVRRAVDLLQRSAPRAWRRLGSGELGKDVSASGVDPPVAIRDAPCRLPLAAAPLARALLEISVTPYGKETRVTRTISSEPTGGDR
ncbi:MAG TPA: hypothetical protein DEF51_01950 [Myxococcales bacterium]|nr:hypothetical protein [Myxococcales bacterium]